MKYPIKGIPENKVIKNVEMDDYFIYVSYLTGEKECFSKYDKGRIIEAYMRQINFFVSGGYSLKTNTLTVRVPSLAIAIGMAGTMVADPLVSVSASSLGIVTCLAGYFADSKALKDSKKKHKVVRDHMQSFYAEYKSIRNLLGKKGERKIQNPEDVIFAIDDMPKSLVYQIGGIDKLY